MVKNAGSKIKCGRLMKNIKSPNSGLNYIPRPQMYNSSKTIDSVTLSVLQHHSKAKRGTSTEKPEVAMYVAMLTRIATRHLECYMVDNTLLRSY